MGADADLVLWDTSAKRKLGAAVGQSGEDVSLYDGFGVHAQAESTIVGGRVAWKDGGVKDAQGSFLPLGAHSPYLFSVVQHRDKVSGQPPVANLLPPQLGPALRELALEVVVVMSSDSPVKIHFLAKKNKEISDAPLRESGEGHSEKRSQRTEPREQPREAAQEEPLRLEHRLRYVSSPFR